MLVEKLVVKHLVHPLHPVIATEVEPFVEMVGPHPQLKNNWKCALVRQVQRGWYIHTDWNRNMNRDGKEMFCDNVWKLPHCT